MEETLLKIVALIASLAVLGVGFYGVLASWMQGFAQTPLGLALVGLVTVPCAWAFWLYALVPVIEATT